MSVSINDSINYEPLLSPEVIKEIKKMIEEGKEIYYKELLEIASYINQEIKNVANKKDKEITEGKITKHQETMIRGTATLVSIACTPESYQKVLNSDLLERIIFDPNFPSLESNKMIYQRFLIVSKTEIKPYYKCILLLKMSAFLSQYVISKLNLGERNAKEFQEELKKILKAEISGSRNFENEGKTAEEIIEELGNEITKNESPKQ